MLTCYAWNVHITDDEAAGCARPKPLYARYGFTGCLREKSHQSPMAPPLYYGIVKVSIHVSWSRKLRAVCHPHVAASRAPETCRIFYHDFIGAHDSAQRETLAHFPAKNVAKTARFAGGYTLCLDHLYTQMAYGIFPLFPANCSVRSTALGLLIG